MLAYLFCILTCLFLFQNSAKAQSWSSLYRQADSLSYLDNDKETLTAFYMALEAAKTEFEPNSDKVLDTRNRVGESMMLVLSNTDEIRSFLQETIQQCKIKDDKSDYYIQAVLNQTDLELEKGSTGQAYLLCQQILPLVETNGQTNPLLRSTCLERFAKICVTQSDFLAAEKYYEKAATLSRTALGENSSEHLRVLFFWADAYISVEKYKEAEALIQRIFELDKSSDSMKNIGRAKILLARIYSKLDRYAEAETLYKNIIKEEKAAGKGNSQRVQTVQQNLAALYTQMGNFETALQIFDDLKQTVSLSHGDKSDKYATLLGNIAKVHLMLGNFPMSEKFFRESAQIAIETGRTNTTQYISLLGAAAIVYEKLNRLDTASQLYAMAIKQSAEVIGNQSRRYADDLFNYGLFLQRQRKPQEAEPVLRKSTEILRVLLGNEHSSYMHNLSALALIYMQTDHKARAQQVYDTLKNWALKQPDIHFATLSEQQKESYSASYIMPYLEGYYVSTIQSDPQKYAEELYNAQIATKSFLLQSAQKLKTTVLKSNDSTLNELYKQWINQKQKIINALSMSIEQRNNANIKLDSIQLLAEDLEKELATKAKKFGYLAEKKQLVWQEVQQQLKKDEAIVEILRYAIKGQAYYAALVLCGNALKPIVVQFDKQYLLEKEALTYFNNCIQYQLPDTLSYKRFWQPIAAQLKGIKRVYLSPDGIYNILSVNSLWNTESKKYLFQELEVVQVINSKSILQNNAIQKKSLQKTAELMGYPLYRTQTDSLSTQKLVQKRGINMNGITPLPGTMREIERIRALLKAHNYQVNVQTAAQASEKNIKKIKSPTLLHIATHGYFVSNSQGSAKSMLNAGLLLAGCSDPEPEQKQPEQEDGILTALEAIDMDLSNTDLVVLSACETGLGRIKAGEGVYGLQRAFMVAGAKAVLMSLWKVDDEATQRLMVAFYKNLLAGKTKRQAFKNAQKALQKQYPDPYYWGAFIMVE